MLPAQLPQIATPDDWRILRLLAIYRLLLVALLIGLCINGFSPYSFDRFSAAGFFQICIAYGIAAIALLPSTFLGGFGIRLQTHLGFATDTLALVMLVFAAKGIGSGFGVLLITPAVGCSLILSTRMALLLAASATVMLLGEEFLRQSTSSFDSAATTETGLLGLILFGTVTAANMVARRARKGEALAARVGIDLADLSQLNERIVESMGTGVLVLDAQRHIVLLNLAARRLIGVSRGSNHHSLADYFPALATALTRWEQNPDLLCEPLSAPNAAPAVIPRFTRLGWNPSAPVLALLDDAARVGEQAQQIKLAALGRLSASIAHEIRNPLSAIHHASQLLAESEQLGAQDRRLLDMIQRHSVRIDKIVQDVMGLSRRIPAAPATLDLRDFLQRSLVLYHEAHPGQPRPVVMDEIDSDLRVRFDPNQLQQILFNLWDNTFAHGVAAAGETLQVRLSAGRLAPRGQIYLDVLDNGGGIAAAQRDKIFEPFFTTAHSGTGLGLYLARELCDYNRGRLDYVETKNGGSGACFRLSFAS
jgi:two-component system sensor histidine kinase PilS (NtrC family)